MNKTCLCFSPCFLFQTHFVVEKTALDDFHVEQPKPGHVFLFLFQRLIPSCCFIAAAYGS